MTAFRSCTVIGAGFMGPQIAVALAACAERVRLYDTDSPLLALINQPTECTPVPPAGVSP